MNRTLPIIIVVCMAIYSCLFFIQEEHTIKQESSLSPAIPTEILNIIGHTYLKQLIAEVLYIKVAVYYGGLEKEPTPENLTIMAEHFKAMSQLHPLMIDIYYRAESAMAHRDQSYVSMVNQILETGRIAMPNEIALPFFEGFNYLNYLDKPLKAAKILKIASEIPHAPQWIGHLASVLMAGEGNIRSGLALLQNMYANSQNKQEKERYQKDIIAFEKALQVQKALNLYKQQHKKVITNLQELIPDYLTKLPVWNQTYHLEYHPPTLSLRRKKEPKNETND